MPYQHVLFELSRDGIAQITISRPEKLNTLNADVMSDLEQTISLAETDAGVRALLFTGSGEKAFAAGVDIQELAGLSPFEARQISLHGQALFQRLNRLPKPSLAAINGYALGGGLELALSCTLRVAADHARLGLPEVKLGLLPGYGGTQILPRLVGKGRALELMLTGEPVDAVEAHRIGLVNHVVERASLLEFSRELLGKILENAPIAAGLILEAVHAGFSGGLNEGLRFESAAFGLAAAAKDHREGTQAFLEKRKPRFTGK